ncbi:MAG: DNA repair protein RecO [Bryobacteraceae bacterium]
MPARVSEAIILRSYPLQEADLVVSFFTRDQGKLRGVAKRARRPKSAFGAGLERLSLVRMAYFQRESRELVNLDSCELIHSSFLLQTDYTVSVALDFMAEISEHFLPAGEANEKFFRLLMAMLEATRAGPESVWRTVTYFSYWTVRLAGVLPALHACSGCGSWLDDPENPQRAYFTRQDAGVYCGNCRRRNGWELSAASRKLAEEMSRKPVGQLEPGSWSKEASADLRHFLLQQMEEAIERKLVTAAVLEAL